MTETTQQVNALSTSAAVTGDRAAARPPTTSDPLWLPAMSLAKRDVVRFLRQRSRVVGAFGTPVVFWLLLGCGLGGSFRMPGEDNGINYLQYSFPGMMVLIVLFTSIFSTISVIEDRREGFLQAVLVSPSRRLAIVLGKVFGSTALALTQAALFLLLGPLVGIALTPVAAAATIAALTIVAVGLSALGLLLAWSMDSIQGFHAIMNLLLMPMWLLSGAFFPAAGASTWMAWIMAVNPLTYGVSCVRFTLALGSANETSVQAIGMPVLFTLAFAGVMLALCTRAVDRHG